MSKRERRPTRRQKRLIDRDRSVVLVAAAGQSLGMEPDEAARAHDVLTGVELEPDEVDAVTAAAILVRCCDMLEARGHSHFGEAPIDELRGQVARSWGTEFVSEVAQTGEPAAAAALRIASLLLVLLVLFAGTGPTAQLDSRSSHKIHAVNLARALALLKIAAWWRGKRGGWGPRFSHGRARRLRTGRRSARSSSRRPASLPSSSSGSISARTPQPSSSAPASPSTPSDAPADRSSDRHTLPIRRRPPCASSIADRAEAWATYRLRVQNLLLSLPEGGAA